jgi:leader peptidase (prepilin peptidase) / N-methyltransferase
MRQRVPLLFYMALPSTILSIFLFTLGAVIGSFLNVVIYRLPRGESIVYPGSHCPRCGRALRANDNIPLIGWLSLGGRCRSCGVRIPIRYFGVELLTGLLFVAAGAAGGFLPDLALVHSLLLIALFIPIIFIDQDLRIVPDELSAPLLLLGLIWNGIDAAAGRPWLITLQGPTPNAATGAFSVSLPTSIVYAVICAGIFWLVQWFGEIVFRKEAMGLGDVNIAAGIGANFPLLAALLSFGIAVGLGAVVGVGLILMQRGKQAGRIDHQVAFGPMLLAGALIMLVAPGPAYHLVGLYQASVGLQ